MRLTWNPVNFLQWCLRLCCALALLMAHAHAATPVSGLIGSSTTWRAAQSPYVLQGDVILDNNATLVIEPGVEVRMEAGASFTLRRGALQALGTAAQPIVVTSNAATPAPGDWSQWRFTAGTVSAQTQLDNVRIAYGSGVVIEGASPVLNNVAIQNHSGPAIGIDLAASPIGKGLSASGNTLNAIAVPSGTIRSQVVWGLVGIPYLVQSGLVQVGQAPLALDPARLRLSPGVVAVLRLSLNAPAPAGGFNVDLTSSVPSVASVAARATVAAGQAGADVEVQANAVGTTTITASQSALGTAVAQVEVVNLPMLEIAPGAPTVGVQRPYPMLLKLPQPAPAGGLSVLLSSSDTSVVRAPASLFVPAGQQGASFEVTGLVEGVSRVSAQAEGFATGLATVTVRSKSLVLPGSVVVAPGAQTPVTLELTEPAPAGGLSVSLNTGASSIASAPETVTVAAGSSQASFSVAGVALGSTTLQASASGYQAAQATVRVDAIGIDIEPGGNLALSIDQVLTRRVILSKAAPPGGVIVKVASADPAIATVSPAEVFVPQGQILGLVPLTVKGIGLGTVAINLSAPGLINKAVPVLVREKIDLRFFMANNQSKVVVGKGMRTYTYYDSSAELFVGRMVKGVVSNPAEPLTISLRCVDVSICTVPATVTIAANNGYAAIPVTGVGIGSTVIEATAQGVTAATPIPVEVVSPVVNFSNLDGTRTTASVRDNFTLQLSVPGAYYSTSQYAVSPLTVSLSLAEQMPAGVVSGIYNAATGGAVVNQIVIGASRNYTDTIYVAQPAQAGTYRVAADIAGIASGQSAVQTVAEAHMGLKFAQANNQPKVVVGKGLRSYNYYDYLGELYVQRVVNGVVANGAQPLTVSLRCVDIGVCSVPASVTIPADSSQVVVSVTGTGVGSTVIEATAQGVTAATPIPVEVVSPVVNFSNLDGTRTTASVRDNFTLQLSVPGAYYSTSQYAVSPLTVSLSLAEQMPAGVVSGIYNAATGGAVVNQIVIGASRNYTDTIYVAQPAQAGTYRVAADIAGIALGQSVVQTVAEANQGLRLSQAENKSKVIVGKSLRSYASELSVQRVINGTVASGADAVTVSLRCVAETVCTVPTTVTIPAGSTEAAVQITGVDVGSTQIEATASGFEPATINVETVSPQLVFIAALPGSMTVGQKFTSTYFHAYVPGAIYNNSNTVPAQPITITLTSSVPSAATVSSSVVWSAGSNTSAYGTITATAPGTTRITASAPGFAPVTSGDITVNP
ncbi:hypothetical protein YS110_05445 [Acidovorax sp. YS12]|nr:hypothetical protein YS110_05445 [Acidovorax sp. YS12]